MAPPAGLEPNKLRESSGCSRSCECSSMFQTGPGGVEEKTTQVFVAYFFNFFKEQRTHNNKKKTPNDYIYGTLVCGNERQSY